MKKLLLFKRHKNKTKITKNKYLTKIEKLMKTIPNWDDMYSESVPTSSRVEQLIRVEVIGKPLCDRYSWAIPNSTAINILHHFSPIIEIGCGQRYWGTLLEQLIGTQNDYIGVDKFISSSSWGDVIKGGPSVLKKSKYSNYTLFLCYPDEAEGMAIRCLQHYRGDYIIHAGELMVTGGTLSYPQAPWGRTTSSDFQVALAEDFHCILITPLPRFPFSNDYLTVWKRTRWVLGKEHALGTDTQGLDMWASIPPEERLPITSAAPCLAQFLTDNNSTNSSIRVN